MLRRISVLSLLLSSALSPGFANAVEVAIDVGNYQGQFDIDNDGNRLTGSVTVDLEPGWHKIRPSAQVGFHVDASGLVTLQPDYDGVSANGGLNQLTLLTVPVTIDPVGYEGNWGISWAHPVGQGGATVHLVATNAINQDGSTGGQYTVQIGIGTSKIRLNVLGDGSLEVRDGNDALASAVAVQGSSVLFRNVDVTITDRDESGILWHLREATEYWNVGDLMVTLVPDVRYAFETNVGISEWVWVYEPCATSISSVDANGSVFEIACAPLVSSVLDQENDPGTFTCSATLGPGQAEPPAFAQTVTAGLSGTLAQVQANLYTFFDYDGSDMEVQIRTVETEIRGGNPISVPGSVVLGSKFIAAADLPRGLAFAEVDFTDLGIEFSAGDEFAIVWTREPYSGTGRSNIVFACSFGDPGDSEGLYAGGTAFFSQADQSTWGIYSSSTDYQFRTYMNAGEANLPPTAIAGPDQSIRAGDTVFLDAGASFDDNTATSELQFFWSFSALPEGSTAVLSDASSVSPSFVADLAATYAIEVVATDAGGLTSAPDSVVVSASNLAPTAHAGSDRLVIVGEVAELDGSASSDPEGDSLTFDWSLLSAPQGSTANILSPSSEVTAIIPDLAGVYGVELAVRDALGPGPSDQVEIVATTAAAYSEIKIAEAANRLMGLASDQVTTKGNQNALHNFLRQAIVALQSGDLAEAISRVTHAIGRVDGCVLRGSVDGNGPSRDWVLDCSDQAVIFGLLDEARNALI
jgi:hypothetical protein